MLRLGASEFANVLRTQLCLLLHELERQHQPCLFIRVVAMLLPEHLL
jgi:hypothetical protein